MLIENMLYSELLSNLFSNALFIASDDAMNGVFKILFKYPCTLTVFHNKQCHHDKGK